jgi:type VI secretion system protein ImpC
MTNPITFDELDFKIVASMEPARAKPDPQTPFRILVAGDFSGRGRGGDADSERPSHDRKVMEVDRDNFDEVLARLAPQVRVVFADTGLPPIDLSFAELDDFHPDPIYARLEVFRSLRENRANIESPEFSDAIARALRNDTQSTSKPPSEAPAADPSRPPPEISDLEGSGLLDQVLDASGAAQPDRGASSSPSGWDRFLQEHVRPHLVPDVEPHVETLREAIDQGISALMRRILHHPDVQSLEAAWRGLDFLVRRLQTDETLKVFLLDISKEALVADLAGVDDLKDSLLYKRLVKDTVETPGADPWSVVAGMYTFGAGPHDAALVARIAAVAAAAGAPFVAGADPRLLGCASLPDTPDPAEWKHMPDENATAAWKALRQLPQAGHVGLALPRFLLRLPYGQETDPTETFQFEEMEGRPIHAHYLWSNPCIACSELLGRAFQASGWNLRPGSHQEIAGLPLHVYRSEGETRIKACAEVLLTERAAAAMLESGLMPLLSFRDQDVVRLARFQSIADPPAALAGRWQ